MPEDASDPSAASDSSEASRGVVDARFAAGIEKMVPHNHALGFRFVEVKEGKVSVRLPYDERLVGDPETGVLAGGPITSLMDATCGVSVFVRLRERIRIATLDLRIDYLKPGRAGHDVIARAECFKLTRHIAFVRCEAFHRDAPADLIAVANGTFMLFRRQKRDNPTGPPQIPERET